MTDADLSSLRSLTARKLIRALEKDGFYVESQFRGAHQQFYNANDGRRVTVTYHHASDVFVPKTLKSMLEQAKWTQHDLKRLGLVK